MFPGRLRRNNRLLFRTARGVVPDDAEAQDVVQETYLRAFTNLRSYRGDATLATWLARIAINVAVTSQRKKGRLVQLQEGGSSADPDPVEHAMPLHSQLGTTPGRAVQPSERPPFPILAQFADALRLLCGGHGGATQTSARERRRKGTPGPADF